MSIIKKLTLTIVICIGVFALAACGTPKNEDGTVSIIGTWMVTSTVDADGVETIIADIEFENDEEAQLAQIPYEFNEDGTFSVMILGTNAEGTYEFDGETLTMDIGGAEMIAKYNSEKDSLDVTDDESGAKTIITRK